MEFANSNMMDREMFSDIRVKSIPSKEQRRAYYERKDEIERLRKLKNRKPKPTDKITTNLPSSSFVGEENKDVKKKTFLGMPKTLGVTVAVLLVLGVAVGGYYGYKKYVKK